MGENQLPIIPSTITKNMASISSEIIEETKNTDENGLNSRTCC